MWIVLLFYTGGSGEPPHACREPVKMGKKKKPSANQFLETFLLMLIELFNSTTDHLVDAHNIDLIKQGFQFHPYTASIMYLN